MLLYALVVGGATVSHPWGQGEGSRTVLTGAEGGTLPRPQIHVREAHIDDIDVLLELWSRTMPGVLGADPDRADALTALTRTVDDPAETLLLAERQGVLVGSLHLRAAPIGPLQTAEVLHSSYLLVHPDHRAQGCARTLLEAAVQWAEDRGIKKVTAITNSDSRDNNRFLARVGVHPARDLPARPDGGLAGEADRRPQCASQHRRPRAGRGAGAAPLAASSYRP